MSFLPLRARSAEAWLRSVPEAGPVVLYKHSPVCPVSARVVREVAAFAERFGQIPVYLVDVVTQQALSQDLARTLGVEHRSPQLVWLTDRQVDWSVEYYEIRGTRLEREAAHRGILPEPGPPADHGGRWWRPGLLQLAFAGPVVRRAARIALPVGAVLIGIDQGPALAQGSLTGASVVRMLWMVALPYLVVVALTVVAAVRRPRH